MGQISDINLYFKTACRNHINILHDSQTDKHFFRFNLAEMLSALRSDMKFPAVGLENISGRIDDEKSDNKRFSANTALVFIMPCEMDNYQEQEEIMDKMLQLGIDFLGKIHKDVHQPLNSAIKFFDFSDVDISPIGPIFENHFGYRFSFTINNAAKIYFNPSMWNNESNYPE